MSALATLLLLTPHIAAAPVAEEFAVIEAQLHTIDEIRRLDVVEPDENMFVFDKPGLTLTFGVEMPEGRTLLEIAQPETVTATDAEGTDLSAIEPDFMGDVTYVEIEQVWGEAPSTIEFTLALPRRSAATFSLAAQLTATSYGSLQTSEIPLTGEWAELDAAMFGGESVSARLTEEDGSPQVEFKPGTIRNYIEEVYLLNGGAELETGMSMWNDQLLTFMFDGEPAAAMTLKLTVRRDLEKVTIDINLKDQDLP